MSRSDRHSSFGYCPALDGLRAVAILGVLVFHALPGTLRGGFTGVDVFFVLSGYLITSIILHDVRDGAFSLREFYLRRVQRLLPNAALTVGVTILLSLILLTPSATVQAARHGFATLFSLSNVYIVRSAGGYWGDTAASFPLLHTWSLALEEQFYLLFPVFLLLLARRSGRHVPAVVGLLALASFSLGVAGTANLPVETFYLLPTRVWELLLGAGLAAIRVPTAVHRPLRRFAPSLALEVGGWVGLALIVTGFVVITGDSGFPGAVALLPTVGALLVLVSVADSHTRTARVLSTRPMVTVGKASYSLYLWHWPLIVLGRTYADMVGMSPLVGGLIGAAAGIALSVLAYTTVERPLRRRGPGRRRRLAVIAAGFSVCAVLGLGLSFWNPLAYPDLLAADPGQTAAEREQTAAEREQTATRPDTPAADPDQTAADLDQPFEQPVFRGKEYDATYAGDIFGPADVGTRFADVYFPPVEPRSETPWKTGGIVRSYDGGTPQIVVLGSSHALMYAGVIDDICKEAGISVAFLSAGGHSVFAEGSSGAESTEEEEADRSFYEARTAWVREWDPAAVIVVDRWDSYAADPTEFGQRFDGLLAELEPIAQRIIVLNQVPALKVGEEMNLREYVMWYRKRRESTPVIPPDKFEEQRRAANSALETAALEHPKLELIRADALFYNADGSVRYMDGRTFYYADDDHLADAGAALVREPLTRAITSSCGVPTPAPEAAALPTLGDRGAVL